METRILFRRVLKTTHWLSGYKPVNYNGWHKSGQPVFVCVREIRGENPYYKENCVQVCARRSPLLAELNPIPSRNDCWGDGLDYSMVARPGYLLEFAHLVEFVSRAYRASCIEVTS